MHTEEDAALPFAEQGDDSRMQGTPKRLQRTKATASTQFTPDVQRGFHHNNQQHNMDNQLKDERLKKQFSIQKQHAERRKKSNGHRSNESSLLPSIPGSSIKYTSEERIQTHNSSTVALQSLKGASIEQPQHPSVLPRVYVPGFSKFVAKKQQHILNGDAALNGNGINSYSTTTTNSHSHISNSVQQASAKQQQKILDNLSERHSQFTPYHNSNVTPATLTHRFETMSTGNFQILLNRNAELAMKSPIQIQRNSTQATSAHPSSRRQTTHTMESVEQLGNQETSRALLKNTANEICKIVVPNAYKMLKMKMTEQPLPKHQLATQDEVEEHLEATQTAKIMTLNEILDQKSHQNHQKLTTKGSSFVYVTEPDVSQVSMNKDYASSLAEESLLMLKSLKNGQSQQTMKRNSSSNNMSLMRQFNENRRYNSKSVNSSHANMDSICNESAILSQEKATLINEINGKKAIANSASSVMGLTGNNNSSSQLNFYGKFLARCLEKTSMEMHMSPIKSKKKKELFETDFEKIKTSSQLLDVIDKELFNEADKVLVFDDQNQSVQTSIGSKKIQQKKAALTSEQKERLFSVLADTDKVVVHTSQNKDLMAPTERKDVVRLASWLEDMLAKIYNIKDLDFLEYFESMQLVCSACMSELIRQISVSVSERGCLARRVWESMLQLMKQAFEELTKEKMTNERSLKNEIKSIHKMYLAKLDELLPQIESQKQQIETKEQTNKRVVMEFRYLRKKDAKLEKYLKQAKKDLRLVEEDYQKLEKDLEAQKVSYERQEQELLKTIADLKKASLIKLQEEYGEGAENKQKKGKVAQDAASRIKGGFDSFNKNYEAYNKDVKSLTEQYEKEVRDFNKKNRNSIPTDQIQNMEEAIYSNIAEKERLLSLDERIIEEISGSDGMKLLIGHCGVQVGPDLLKLTDQAVDTALLIVLKDRTTQTFVAEIDVKEVQTPLEWMKHIDHQGKHLHREQRNGNVLMEYDEEVEKDDDGEIESERQRIDEAEQIKFEKMKEVLFRTEDQENEERSKLLAIPLVRDYLNNGDAFSPMGKAKSSLTGGWKDEDQLGRLRPVVGKVATLTPGIENGVQEEENEGSMDSEDSVIENGNQGGEYVMDSITSMVQNTVERDLDDLYMLVMSRTAQMNMICDKIIKFNLLKDNNELEASTLSSFVEDSQKLIVEEHSRLKRIWQRSRFGLLDSVKQKLLIAEKDAELEEVINRKSLFEEQIREYKDMVVNGIDETKEINSKSTSNQLRSSGHEDKSNGSQDENNSEEGNDEDDDDIDIDQNSFDEEDKSEPSQLKPTNSAISESSSPSMGRRKRSDNLMTAPSSELKLSSQKSQMIQLSQKKKSIAILDKDRLKSQLSTFGFTSAATPTPVKQKKRKETNNPFNRVSVSLIEAVMMQRNMIKQESERQISIEKRFTEIPVSKKTSNSLSSISLTQWLRQNAVPPVKKISNYIAVSTQQITTQNTILPSSSVVLGGTTNQSGATAGASSTINQGVSTNADSAAQFFNKVAAKYIRSKAKANIDPTKRAIMKQQTVIRHIQNIYLDKMRLLKNGEESSIARALNVVTYDYFLNQFGFKKLAESKLTQFLDSAMYYNVAPKVRMFTKLYGINRIMNYDFEDFDVFIRLMLYLEDGSTQAQLAAGIYPVNRASEALFRYYENKIPSSELLRLKQEMDTLKVQDQTQKQKNKFAIDADSALDVLLQAHVEEKKICIQNIQSVFIAANVNGDSIIGQEEFLLLYRHFEVDSFSTLAALSLYYNNCDLVDRYTGQKIMSFQKFALTCVQFSLFMKPAQDAFANRVISSDRIAGVDALHRFWEDKKDVIRLRFVKNSSYKLQFRQMIRKIDAYFATDKQHRTVLDRNSTWFTYRLLDEESKRVMLESQMGTWMDGSLLAIGSTAESLFLKVANGNI